MLSGYQTLSWATTYLTLLFSWSDLILTLITTQRLWVLEATGPPKKKKRQMDV